MSESDAPAVPARLQDVPQYIPCLNGSPDGHRWDRCAICGTGRNGTIEPASDLRAGLIGPVVYGWHANGMIAALNEWISTPGYVRLEDFAALQRDLAAAREALYVPNQWICPTCGFVLSKMLLRASDGAVGIDTREVTEICTNDGSSLIRLTYEQASEANGKNAVENAIRGHELESKLEAAEARLATVTQALYEATHGMERSAPGADMA